MRTYKMADESSVFYVGISDAHDVRRGILESQKDVLQNLKRYEEYHSKLGSSLGTVINHYNNSGKELKKVDRDILRITGDSPGLDTKTVDQPEEIV